MKKYALLVLCCSFASIGWSQSIKMKGIRTTYPAGTENYAAALTQVLETGISEARQSGYKLPKKIDLDIRETDRRSVFNNGATRITLEFDTISRFTPPGCAYYICGEINGLGTLALINAVKMKGFKKMAWMNPGFRQRWSLYFASALLDSIYDITSDKVWPEPYDFKKHGTQNLTRISNDPDSPLYNEANAWIDLGNKIGFENLPDFFTAFKKGGCSEGSFFAAVYKYMGEEDASLWIERYRQYIVL